MNLSTAVVGVVRSFSFVGGYQHFGGTYRLCLRVRNTHQVSGMGGNLRVERRLVAECYPEDGDDRFLRKVTEQETTCV